MKLTVNDEAHTLSEGASLSDLLKQLEMLSRRGLAVAVNQTVISSTEWSDHTLFDGDQILVIQATQGG